MVIELDMSNGELLQSSVAEADTTSTLVPVLMPGLMPERGILGKTQNSERLRKPQMQDFPQLALQEVGHSIKS